jgi:hypothetical protein
VGRSLRLFSILLKKPSQIKSYLKDIGIKPNPLQWKIIGAITLGVDSFIPGELKSGGAITVGASAVADNLQALGAITLGPLSKVGTVRATGALTQALDSEIVGQPYDPAAQDKDDVSNAITSSEELVTIKATDALLGLE